MLIRKDWPNPCEMEYSAHGDLTIITDDIDYANLCQC